MNKDLYSKLVDLYAGDELPTELKEDFEQRLSEDADLKAEALALQQTVAAIKSVSQPVFGDETRNRILRTIEQRARIEPQRPAAAYLQYQLPMQG